MRTCLTFWFVGFLNLGLALSAGADEEKKTGQEVALAGGRITLTAPQGWRKQQPRVAIIEHEFAIPAAEGDKDDGRLTIMAAGGSVEQNIERWIGQFSQPGGKSAKAATKTEKLTLDGQTVHLVDISGTFRDQRGPFAPPTVYEGYRMLGAIISTDDLGRYFVKLTGPEKAIAEQEKAFREFIASLDVK